MTLYKEAQEIFKEEHGDENMNSRQVKALADATELRLDELYKRIIFETSSSN